MKRLKIFTVGLIIFCLSIGFCNSVMGTDATSEDINMQDSARTVQEEGEPVVTSEDGTEPINEDNDENTDADHLHDQSEIHEGDLYIFQNDYVMDELVDGNVFIFGRNIKITGQVNGSVFVCADKVELEKDSYIACHLFVAAEEVIMNGMALDVYSASNTLKLGSDTLIYRQIKSVASNVNLAGTIGRDAEIFANKIDVDKENLSIYGNLNYEAKNEIENAKDFVEGEVIFKESKEHTESAGEIALDYVFSVIGTIIFDVLIYLSLIFFAPKFVKKSKEYVSTKGMLAFVIGLAFIFGVPVIAFLLCLTGVMSGIAMFALAIYATVLMVNALVVSTTANEFIANKLKIEDKFKKVLMIIPVSIVLWGVRQIPFVGPIISAVVCLLGIGIVVLYQFDRRKEQA